MESAFCEPIPAGLKVIETLRFESGFGCVRADLHLARAARTCADLGFVFDANVAARALGRVESDQNLRVRLTVNQDGKIELESAKLTESTRPWRFYISEQRLSSTDPWLRVKTTQRALYNKTRTALPKDLDEVIFLNEDGHLCEGTITNLFIQKGRDLLTPPVSCGLLPGILRQELLKNGKAKEAILTEQDLAQASAIFLGNSLRGLLPAQLK